MVSGQERRFTGTVERHIVAKGSKSEHEALFLRQDDPAAPLLKIRLHGGNPFYEAALEPFVGKRVSFEAVVLPAAIPSVLVRQLSDISIIAPPARQAPKKGGPKL